MAARLCQPASIPQPSLASNSSVGRPRIGCRASVRPSSGLLRRGAFLLKEEHLGNHFPNRNGSEHPRAIKLPVRGSLKNGPFPQLLVVYDIFYDDVGGDMSQTLRCMDYILIKLHL